VANRVAIENHRNKEPVDRKATSVDGCEVYQSQISGKWLIGVKGTASLSALRPGRFFSGNALTFRCRRAMISTSFGFSLQLALSHLFFDLACFLDPPCFLSPGHQRVLGESGHLLSPFIFQDPL
jgi:hypothetical protein